MEIKNFKFNDKELRKTVKRKGVALLTGLAIATSSVPALLQPLKVEAASSSYYSTYENNVMNYFMNTLNDNMQNYLNRDLSASNLKIVLGYYNTLYDYINGSKMVRNTYFRNLTDYEKADLRNLLNIWENDIYETYRSTSYFKSTSKNVLGFYLEYNSQETGYDYNHEETMDNYQIELREDFDKCMSNSKSQGNLNSALKVYNKLVKFVKGYTRTDGFVFNELTLTEQNDIYNLLVDWTYSISDNYSNYSYYVNCCRNIVGWTVNMSNVEIELGKNINSTYYDNTTNYYPNNNNVYYPNNNTIYYPNNNTVYYPTTNVPVQQPTNANGEAINNTVGKDWHASYNDPSIDTSRGEPDYAPEYIDEDGNLIRYTQEYNDGTYAKDEYVEDYTPEYIYTR